MIGRKAGFLIIGFVVVYLFVMGYIIANADPTAVATKANIACQGHQGTAPDGIHTDYFICRDGFVVSR